MTAKEYVERIAMELSRARGGGLLLSPADTALALSWHAARVPLAEVSAQVRTLARKRPRSRSSLQQPVSLQLLAARFESRTRRLQPASKEPETFGDALRTAARDPNLAGRSAWQSLADSAEDLLAEGGGEGYWTALVRALKAALRELPRSHALKAGAALRERIAPRPKGMPRRRYQRSLQLMLLSASSERLGLPPPAFLL
ncbi:MAG TPA: hypothetical protein VGH20_00295 [Myxococcales bacterium]